MTHAIVSNLAAADAAAAQLATATDAELADVIHAAHAARGLFGRTTAVLSAALDLDAARTAARVAAVAAADAAAHGDDSWPAPLSGVVTDHYRDHWVGYRQNGPGVGWCPTDRPTRADFAPLSGPVTEPTRFGPASPSDPRFAVRVTTGGSLFDGHAWIVATHKLADDGTEYEAPHTVRLGVIAQPAEVTALRSAAVHFYGRTMAQWDATLSAEDGAVMSGRFADTATSQRHATHALADAVGHNGTHNGESVRWHTLRAESACKLHALAGTTIPAWLAVSDPQRIVGAIPVDLPKSVTRHTVAVDIVERIRTTQDDGTVTITERVSTHHRAPGALNNAGQLLTPTGSDSLPTRVIVGALPHTARTVSIREDLRKGASKRKRTRTTAQRSATATATVKRRRTDALAAAVECRALGVWPSGRADSATVQAAAVLALGATLASLTGAAAAE